MRCYVTISCCPGLQGDNRRGPAFHWNVLVDQRAAAARAHCGKGRDLLLQGEVRKPVILIFYFFLSYFRYKAATATHWVNKTIILSTSPVTRMVAMERR